MNKKEKQLLLVDLSARLPYGVKCKVKYYDDAWNICSINPNGVTFVTKYTGYPIETNWEDCKPYLFPLSSMTEEQKKEEYEICKYYLNGYESKLIDFYHKNHFDYHGLIPLGLALDCTNLNIY